MSVLWGRVGALFFRECNSKDILLGSRLWESLVTQLLLYIFGVQVQQAIVVGEICALVGLDHYEHTSPQKSLDHSDRNFWGQSSKSTTFDLQWTCVSYILVVMRYVSKSTKYGQHLIYRIICDSSSIFFFIQM